MSNAVGSSVPARVESQCSGIGENVSGLKVSGAEESRLLLGSMTRVIFRWRGERFEVRWVDSMRKSLKFSRCGVMKITLKGP